MKINFKNPIIFSLCSIIISFFMFMICIHIVKPSYILEVTHGGNGVNMYLLVTHSLLFSILVGTCTFLLRVKTVKMSFKTDNKRIFIKHNAYSPQ